MSCSCTLRDVPCAARVSLSVSFPPSGPAPQTWLHGALGFARTNPNFFFFFFYSFCGYRDQLCANLSMCVPFKIFYAFNIVVKMPFEIFLPVSLMAEFVVCLHFNEPAFVKRSFPISFFFLLRHTPDSGQRRGRLRAHLPRALFQTIIHGFAQRIHV